MSSIRRDGESRLLQITAPISPGSSGGPLVDAHVHPLFALGIATVTAEIAAAGVFELAFAFGADADHGGHRDASDTSGADG